MTVLPTLGGASARASGLNNLGQVIGMSTTPQGMSHAFVWSDGDLTDLGTLGGAESEALDINDLGEVVGRSMTASGLDRGFLWSGGTMNPIPPLSLGHTISVAWSINKTGLIAGFSRDGSPGSQRGVVWKNGQVLDIIAAGSIAGAESSALAVNDAGVVAGYSDRAHEPSVQGPPLELRRELLLWKDGVTSYHGCLQELSACVPRAINETGEVIGEARDSSLAMDSIFGWFGGQFRSLGIPPGSKDSLAMDINRFSQILIDTQRSGAEPVPLLWQSGTLTDINSLLPGDAGLRVISAAGLNDAGQIAATALTGTGQTVAVLLTPPPRSADVPAPGRLWGLMAAGVLVRLALGRRRQRLGA